MNYADFGLGTWYPKGGMFSVVEAIKQLAIEMGVEIKTNANVVSIEIDNGLATHVVPKPINIRQIWS